MSFHLFLILSVIIFGSDSREINDRELEEQSVLWTNFVFKKLNALLDYNIQLNKRLDDQDIFLKNLITDNKQNIRLEGQDIFLNNLITDNKKNISLLNPEVEPNPWTIIQRRKDLSFNFNRSWSEYKQGFGDPKSHYFIGLDKLHELTAQTPHELRVELQTDDNSTLYSNYNHFVIGNEFEEYLIKLIGAYSGDIDTFPGILQGVRFSTFDRNNVKNRALREYAISGWWIFAECDLNQSVERYRPYSTIRCYGTDKNGFHARIDVKSTTMMIRPVHKD